jgi:hypothetical protein
MRQSDRCNCLLLQEQVLALINSINGSSPTLKLGRRGVSPQVGQALQEMWRGREVVRVRVGDDRTASNRNMVDMGKVGGGSSGRPCSAESSECFGCWSQAAAAVPDCSA